MPSAVLYSLTRVAYILITFCAILPSECCIWTTRAIAQPQHQKQQQEWRHTYRSGITPWSGRMHLQLAGDKAGRLTFPLLFPRLSDAGFESHGTLDNAVAFSSWASETNAAALS